MQRRDFILTAASVKLAAEAPMPMTTLGKTGLKVSRYVVGGYHMNVQGEAMATRIIHRALELGVNFFDSANAYHKGQSDEIYGRALSGGRRQKVLLMTKCERYGRAEAMAVLETQLKRMKTDYLDLWQCHQVSEMKEVDQILGPDGSLEAFIEAKRQGKVRHIGFTGHRDPQIHLRLLAATDAWETVQMPVNCVDPHYLSFLKTVLPEARKRGLGVLAMKSNAMGTISASSVASIEECIRFTLSQNVDALVSGAETVEQLEHNVGVVKSMSAMSATEAQALLSRTGRGPTGSKIERYKRPESGAFLRQPHVDGE